MRINSARLRWIWSAMRALRAVLMDRPPSGDGPRDLDHLEDLDLVANLDVVEALDRQAALEAGLHLAHVLLEALERIELAGVHDDAGTDHAHGRATAHHAIGDHAAGHG